MRVSKQSPIRSRGTRSRHSVGSIVSVQNKVDTGDGEEFQKVSQAAGKVESHSHRQFIGILAKPVKNGHGIIKLLHFIDPRRIVLLQERCAELTKELLQAGLDEKCWAVSMEWYCSLRNVQHLPAGGQFL